MTLSQPQAIREPNYGLMLKSFLQWTGILTVCLLIIGFPIGILLVAFGSILAVALHAVLPGVGLVLVAGGFVALQLVGVLVAAAVLTLKEVHPKNMPWSPWLRGEANPKHESTYAACPLTCSVDE